jgi:hypothetical protein
MTQSFTLVLSILILVDLSLKNAAKKEGKAIW